MHMICIHSVQSMYLKRQSLSRKGSQCFTRKTDSKKTQINFQETMERLKRVMNVSLALQRGMCF